MNATSFVIPAPPQAAIPVAGEAKSFPVRRIWCVGRNYLEHIREMGNDERAPPFFFAKHADMIEPDGATIPYPPLTKDLHHEVELIVAMKSGGPKPPPAKAPDPGYGHGVGLHLTPRQGARPCLRRWGRRRSSPPRPADRRAQEGAAVGGRKVVRPFRPLLGA